MQKSLDVEFEKAVRFLAEHFPVSKEDSRKPVLFHDIRVGVYLYEKNYSREVVLAGLLHDALEWSKAAPETIEEAFGKEVLELVAVNTKNRDIADGDERIVDLASRAAAFGKEALLIRAADTLDSFKHYSKTQNQPELEYCRKNAEAIFRHKKEDWDDEVFEELKRWMM